MAEKKKMTATEKWAAKNKKKTTSKDVPGAAKGAAKAIEKRRKYLDEL